MVDNKSEISLIGHRPKSLFNKLSGLFHIPDTLIVL